MNEKNYDYLKNQVKFTGFGETLDNELKEKIQGQSSEFHIVHKANFGNEPYMATLNFKKSAQSDMYFLNKYQLDVKSEQTKQLISQTFYINKGNNITLKEAYNLMNGRCINKDLTSKDGQLYNAWMQLDPVQTDKNGNRQIRQYHTNYGFDLSKELVKHPIKELTNERDKVRLMESLQKGNRQSVTFVSNGGEQKYFVEANPQFKTINIYDSSMHRLPNSQRVGAKNERSDGGSTKQNASAEKQISVEADDENRNTKLSNKRSRKKGPSIS